MDRIAQKLSNWFGSTPFILMHIIGIGVWVWLHHARDWDEHWATIIVFLTIEIIFISLFILRAENVQTREFEKDVRRDLSQSSKILKEVHKSKKKKKP
jgi:low affinity Fe/Cu permease